MKEKELFRIEFKGRKAVIALAVILLLLAGYWLGLYGQAFKHREEMRDVLRLRIIAHLTGPHQKEMEAIVQEEKQTPSDLERLEHLTDLTRVEVTALAMRGLWLDDMVFRVSYRPNSGSPTEKTAYFVISYSLVRGWLLDEMYDHPEMMWRLAPLRIFQED